MAIYGDNKHDNGTIVTIKPNKKNLIQVDSKGFHFRGVTYSTIELAMEARDKVLKK